MNLEILKQNRSMRISHGRPLPTLTEKEWQNQFAATRLCITPHPPSMTKMGGRYPRGQEKRSNNETYDGITNWQSYCSFINDVLNQIRLGHHDYVYFGYQIIDLLKFHYDTLRTKYCDGYWEVWLDQESQGDE